MNNVYDTANRLAYEIKESKEYKDYKLARQKINENPELKEKIPLPSQTRNCRKPYHLHLSNTGYGISDKRMKSHTPTHTEGRTTTGKVDIPIS